MKDHASAPLPHDDPVDASLLARRREPQTYAGVETAVHDLAAATNAPSQAYESDGQFIGLGEVAMTVATGFSVLFVIAVPVSIVAVSLGLIGLTIVRDSYRRRKNPA